MIQFTEVVKRVAAESGDTPKWTRAVLESFFDLVRVEDVAIRNFGVFRHKATPEKLGRNPKTGETVTIPPRTVLKFRAAKKRAEK